MTLRIGFLSDVHAAAAPVAEALAIFEREGVDRILCGGDIAGYGEELDQTVVLLRESGCQGVIGNHDRWYLEREAGSGNPDTQHYLCAQPLARSFLMGGLFVYLVHAHPPVETMGGMRLLDDTGGVISSRVEQWTARLAGFGYDLLLVGHTHQIFAQQLGETLVINPGSTLFNHSCAILTLPERSVQWFGLSGCEPVSTWNWGEHPLTPP